MKNDVDVLAMLNLSVDDFNGMLVSFVKNNQCEGLFFALNALGNSDIVYNDGNYRVWDKREKQLKSIPGIYSIVSVFVVNNYQNFDNMYRAQPSNGYGFWNVLRDMCINYLNFVGCKCGKPFDDFYFEEDGKHLRCELYQKWAWAHLPPNLRRNFGIFGI